MKNYLSIGEMAKARNIDVQSLRYYEKIGILKPAYVNPENGYRYYSMDQMPILDLIILCIDLGIPLKRFKEYEDESGRIKFESILEDGKKIAKEKMKKINNEINYIDLISNKINERTPYVSTEGYYKRHISERYIITVPWEEGYDEKPNEKSINYLLEMAKKDDLYVVFPHGNILTYQDGEFQYSRPFLEVLKSDSSMIHKLPEGDYSCYHVKGIHVDPTTLFAPEFFAKGKVDVIASPMDLTNGDNTDEPASEYQLLIRQ